MTCKDCMYARSTITDGIIECRKHWFFMSSEDVICSEFKLKKIEDVTPVGSICKYVLKGSCYTCVNRDLPLNSSICVECGISRKNYKLL